MCRYVHSCHFSLFTVAVNSEVVVNTDLAKDQFLLGEVQVSPLSLVTTSSSDQYMTLFYKHLFEAPTWLFIAESNLNLWTTAM